MSRGGGDATMKAPIESFEEVVPEDREGGYLGACDDGSEGSDVFGKSSRLPKVVEFTDSRRGWVYVGEFLLKCRDEVVERADAGCCLCRGYYSDCGVHEFCGPCKGWSFRAQEQDEVDLALVVRVDGIVEIEVPLAHGKEVGGLLPVAIEGVGLRSDFLGHVGCR